MSANETQYRVVWQRQGQSDKRRKHYETLEGATRCMETQRSASEEIDWTDVPPLIFGPVLDARRVGPWSRVA